MALCEAGESLAITIPDVENSPIVSGHLELASVIAALSWKMNAVLTGRRLRRPCLRTSLGTSAAVMVEPASSVDSSHAGQRDSAVFKGLLALFSSLCLCCLTCSNPQGFVSSHALPHPTYSES